MRNFQKVTIILFFVIILAYVLHFSIYKEKPLKPELEISEIGYIESAEVTILIDNNPNFDLESPWGISIYIKTENLNILFDAGPNPEVLKKNSDKLNADLSTIDLIIISHEHEDHVNGLKYIAETNRNLTIYIPKDMSNSCKNWIKNLGFNYIEIGNTTIISNGIAIIGELYGPPYEQALAINVKNLGLIIFVGCSHPGVNKIVAKAKKDLRCEPYAVIGGFHLSGVSLNDIKEIADNLIEMGLKKIYPMHCSGECFREFLKESHPEVYGDGKVGLKLFFKGNQI